MRNALRGRTGVLLALSIALMAAYGVWQYTSRTMPVLGEFDDPKMLILTLESVPLIRENGRPLDVVANSEVGFRCQRLSPKEGTSRFRFTLDGEVRDERDCDIRHTFKGEPGQVKNVSVEFLGTAPGAEERLLDRYAFEIRLVPDEPYVRLRGFGTPTHEPIQSSTVPWEVMPYFEVALPALPNPAKEYVALFFLQREPGSGLLLRVAPPKEAGQAVRPVEARLQNHREYGKMIGYALIPEEPITIGAPEDHRQLFEVTAGVFPRSAVPTLLSRCCGGGATTPGQTLVTVTAIPWAEVEALAVERRLAAPLRVVRAPREQERAGVIGAPTQP
jgi:hypothetical protein